MLDTLEEGGAIEGLARIAMLISKAGSGHRRLSEMQKTREILSPEGEIAHLSEDERRRLLQEETIVVEFEPERARRSLPKLLRTPADRRRAHALLDWTEAQSGLEDDQRRLAAELRALLPMSGARNARRHDGEADAQADAEAGGQARDGTDRRARRPRLTERRRRSDMQQFTNRTYDEIEVGASDSVTRTLTATEVESLSLVAGDVESFHLDLTGEALQEEASAPGAAAIALIAGILNRRLPGPGSAIVGTRFTYHGRVRVGDAVTATVTARAKHPQHRRIDFDCTVTNGDGKVLVEGVATVAAPAKRVAYGDIATPQVVLRRNDGLARLLKRCEGLDPIECAIVHPCDRESLLGAIEAAKRGLIVPVLVGPEAKIRAVAQESGIALDAYRIVGTEHSHAAAEAAVAMARAGEVEALMKGSLHTDELMARGGAVGDRAADRAAHQPRVRDGRARVSADAADHGRRGEHRARPRLQGRHLPQRDRPGARARNRRAEGRDPVRRGNRDAEDRVDAARGRAVQDGRPRPDHRRPARRSARVRQRDLARRRRGPSTSCRPWPGRRTSCSCPTSSPAT